MRLPMQLIITVSATALAGAAAAQTTSAGRAASAAVTPGDQNMGRTPDNRSGGLMGNDRTDRTTGTGVGRAADAAVTPGDQDMGRNPANRSGGLMGNDRTGTGSYDTGSTGSTGGNRPARADRG